MAASLLAPEDIMLPPSPPEPAEPAKHATSGEADAPGRLEDVTITFSLSPTPPEPPQNRSPFPRTHFRSRSLAGPPGTSSMTRAHSTPGLDSRGRYIFANTPGRLEGPIDHTVRRHSPLRAMMEEQGKLHMPPLNISETISEHAVLQPAATSNSTEPDFATSPTLSSSIHYTFPRTVRRQPSSPLHLNPVGGNGQYSNSPTSTHSSPMMLATKFNEAYPGYSFSSGSSVPSTPTSLRSRSPSISSLETIPDIPDAEAAAIEADRVAKQQAEAEKRAAGMENTSDASRRRGTVDVAPSSTTFGSMRTGLGGYGVRADKRKRWSVCGAERRQDLDLETIWED
ncbi:hypothetical protein VTN02DRAFT_3126 [Thermoascus thermophilus]